MLTDADYQELLRQFPPVLSCFAYGSGVVEQGGYNYTLDKTLNQKEKLPMIDLIMIVDDPLLWHQQNMQINPEHYTPCFPMNTTTITGIQEDCGAAVWYNTNMPMNIRRFPSRFMKYGVISVRKILEDLTNWRYLYIAGRLHKPIRIVKEFSPLVIEAIKRNRENALRVALLLLPDAFSELDLYIYIAQISYMGDPRMSIGENPKKVTNLVTPILPIYRELYHHHLHKLGPLVNLQRDESNSALFTYSKSNESDMRLRFAQELPLSLKEKLTSLPPKKSAIRAALAAIVAKSATSQSLKGLLTAGFLKSSIYIYAKITKRFSSKGISTMRDRLGNINSALII